MGKQIQVRKISDKTYEVTVKSKITTHHHVNLQEKDLQRLAGGKVSPEILIQKSFEFLLERESNTTILSSFDLMVISRFFPEYEAEIKKRLG